MDYHHELIIVLGLMKVKWSTRYLPSLIWAGLIILGSSIPNFSGLDTKITIADKIVHFAEYFVLGSLASRAALRSGGVNPGKVAGLIMVVAAFGVLDEMHQTFIPGRTVEILDTAANVSGVLLSIVLYAWLVRRKRIRMAQR